MVELHDRLLVLIGVSAVTFSIINRSQLINPMSALMYQMCYYNHTI